jgi:hypothetical protein
MADLARSARQAGEGLQLGFPASPPALVRIAPVALSVLRRDAIWFAAAAWIIGLAALVCDHLHPAWTVIIGMRTLFAFAATTAIGLVLIAGARDLEGADRSQLYLLTRLVSRWVYILMYVLAIVRVGFYLLESSQHFVRPMDDFQFYIACCVAPLWLVRAAVLAGPFKWLHRTRPPPSRRLSATGA